MEEKIGILSTPEMESKDDSQRAGNGKRYGREIRNPGETTLCKHSVLLPLTPLTAGVPLASAALHSASLEYSYEAP
jgi:hypothetical protein